MKVMLKGNEAIRVKKGKHKLTLDQPATYQIRVQGELDKRWTDWGRDLTITIESDSDGFPISTLTGTVDQAALLGLLRRLYSLGIPLISVLCLDFS